MTTHFGTLMGHHRGRRSQSGVAEALGISRNTLARIESGELLPTGSTLAKVLHHYQTDGGPPISRDALGELMEALIAQGGAR
jgi:transcriptional regulator with XRE-family HTH domain